MSRNLENTLPKLRSTIIHTLVLHVWQNLQGQLAHYYIAYFKQRLHNIFALNLELWYWWKFPLCGDQLSNICYKVGQSQTSYQTKCTLRIMRFLLFLIYGWDFYLMWEYHSNFRSNVSLNHKYFYNKNFFEFCAKNALFDMQDLRHFHAVSQPKYFVCIFLSCHVRISEWIYTLYLP